MAEQQTAAPVEMDRTLVSVDREITDQDDRPVDLQVWVSRDDFAGVVMEPHTFDVTTGQRTEGDWICLNLIGAIKLRDALNDAIAIMGRWQD